MTKFIGENMSNYYMMSMYDVRFVQTIRTLPR